MGGSTVTKVAQLVYGYDGGHRRLTGSIDIGTQADTQLMSATDADPGSNHGFLVTALPLSSERLYALCFTWRASDMPRPGSVWSHVLLLQPEHLRQLQAPYELARFAMRPSPSTLDRYLEPLTVKHFLQEDLPRQDALQRAVATLAEQSPAEIVTDDLEEAARAFGYLWGLQWPELRSRFRFRTRNIAREIPQGEVQAVRKTRQMGRQESTVSAQRATHLTKVIRSERDTVQHFLAIYGPSTRPNLSNFMALVDVYVASSQRDALKVRSLLEAGFSGPLDALSLKADLFSDQSVVFTEDEAVASLLQAAPNSWDDEALQIAARVNRYVQRHGLPDVVSQIPSNAHTAVLLGVSQYLQSQGSLNDLLLVLSDRPSLVRDVDITVVNALKKPQEWRRVSATDARSLLKHLPFVHGAVLAAVAGGHGKAVADRFGLDRTVSTVISEADGDLCKQLLEALPGPDIDWSAYSDEEVLFLVSCWPDAYLPATLAAASAALLNRRDHQDAQWLDVAALVLSSGDEEAERFALELFGPLHRAMTENRLPDRAWSTLDKILPRDNDPAQRLRRYFLSLANSFDWTKEDVRWSLRDAGPYIDESLWPSSEENEDGWKTVRAALASLGLTKKGK